VAAKFGGLGVYQEQETSHSDADQHRKYTNVT